MDKHANCTRCKGRGYVSDGQPEDGMMTGRAPCPGEEPELVLLRATVRKLRAERKVMHEMLTDVGIRADVLGDGVRTCLIGRMAIAIGMPSVSNSLVCTCRKLYEQAPNDHRTDCPLWK